MQHSALQNEGQQGAAAGTVAHTPITAAAVADSTARFEAAKAAHAREAQRQAPVAAESSAAAAGGNHDAVIADHHAAAHSLLAVGADAAVSRSVSVAHDAAGVAPMIMSVDDDDLAASAALEPSAAEAAEDHLDEDTDSDAAAAARPGANSRALPSVRYKKKSGPRLLQMADTRAVLAQFSREDFQLFCESSQKQKKMELKQPAPHVSGVFVLKDTCSSQHVTASCTASHSERKTAEADAVFASLLLLCSCAE